MNESYYFSHDYSSRSDEKIKKLLRKHGYLGYGLFWAIVEELYMNANALQTDYEGIAFDLHSNPETIKSIINDFDLFEVNDNLFGSLSIQRRLDERNEKSGKARLSALKRWNKDINGMPLDSERNANASKNDAIKERKGKESKVKDSIEEENKTYREFKHLKLSIEDFDKLILLGYKKSQVDDILDRIENFKNNIKYSNLFLTAKTWLKKEYIENNKIEISIDQNKTYQYKIPNFHGEMISEYGTRDKIIKDKRHYEAQGLKIELPKDFVL